MFCPVKVESVFPLASMVSALEMDRVSGVYSKPDTIPRRAFTA